jgi:hypothetical protein
MTSPAVERDAWSAAARTPLWLAAGLLSNESCDPSREAKAASRPPHSKGAAREVRADRPLSHFLTFLLAAGFMAVAAAGDVLAAPVRAMMLDGTVTEGAWLGMQGDKLMLSVEGKETPLEPAQLMSLHWVATTSQPAPVSSSPGDVVVVHLADGSRFPARITESDGERISLDTGLVPELDLQLSRVAGIRFSPDESAPAMKSFTDAMAGRDATEDVLIVVQDGKVNTLRGMLELLNAGGATFKWRNRSVPVNRDRIFGIVLATGAGVAQPPPARCILNNESIWAGRLVGGDAESVRLELAAGPTLDIAADLLHEIRFNNDHLRFLSDMQPSNYEFTPWGTTRWPYRNDRSVANRPMRIGGTVFDRGIGMHSQSKLTYILNEPFRQFVATIGIDDAVGSRGNVVFRVLADGREVFNSGPVTGRDEPRPVLVELNGARTLQLAVDFGEDLDIGDQANWGSARLIK